MAPPTHHVGNAVLQLLSGGLQGVEVAVVEAVRFGPQGAVVERHHGLIVGVVTCSRLVVFLHVLHVL